ncbi:MAG: DNA/RNA non-specific endonuclease [Muribaculaceae bacterium]|nr:DNA/RNA non-specific endonuclease [Muribaculaceae bacterium]
MKKSGKKISPALLLISAAIIIIGTITEFAKGCSPTSNGMRIYTAADSLMIVHMPDSVTSEMAPGYDAMDISFNPRYKVPNYVAWILTRDKANGQVGRENKFYTDVNVSGCPSPDDYKYSGYDRGHMAPAGDMKWSNESMHESFSMANICPQAKTLNTGAWKNLEEKCRTWAIADSAIIIVCGPIFTTPPEAYIGSSHVAVPSGFFKVVLSPYANPPRGIGFIMPNGRVDGGMQRAAVSIDSVESVTGFDFFTHLPDSIERIVESQCDFPYWSTIR